MLRFPNPGSTIGSFVAVYKAAFEQLHGQVVDLDDLVEATVSANLATSSGYMGSEAISRSTRSDRSRDPLYNQLKMYAELFRALGWLHPTENSALKFTFTPLGHQIVAAEQHYLPLLGETVLGISYPSHVLRIKRNYDVRPFALMLRTMLACDGSLSRDEMIVGPLSVRSDRSSDAVSQMVDLIAGLREDPKAITEALEDSSLKRGVQVNTLKNYTRWPIAIMRDLGWTEKVNLRFQKDGQSFEVYKLTEAGKKIAEYVCAATDIRVDQVDALPAKEKAAISTHAHYSMLERSGFDLESVKLKLNEERPDLERALEQLEVEPDSPLLFSPFQSLSIADTRDIFQVPETTKRTDEQRIVGDGNVVGRGSRNHLFVEPEFVHQVHEYGNDELTLSLKEKLRVLRSEYGSAEEAATAFVDSHASDTKDQFYPLVSCLFCLLGFDSKSSRPGVNYQRWDAYVWLNEVTVPIEIKSPAEEEFLSTKAIRQAIENKVVLLVRKGLNTSPDSTTLIVGYKIPSERGDMSMLIDDVFGAFGISIGVIDFHTLALLAIRSVTENLTIQHNQLGSLRGFLHA